MAEEQQPVMTAAGLKAAYDKVLNELESGRQNALHELNIETSKNHEKLIERYASEKKEAYRNHNFVTAFLITSGAARKSLAEENRLKKLSEAKRIEVDTRFKTAVAIASEVYATRLFDYEKKLGREISGPGERSASLNREIVLEREAARGLLAECGFSYR